MLTAKAFKNVIVACCVTLSLLVFVGWKEGDANAQFNLTLDYRVSVLENKLDVLEDRFQLLAVLFCQTVPGNNLNFYSFTGYLNWNGAQCYSSVTAGIY